MAEEREKISDGPNDRPLNETIAGTGPGIQDDSLAPGETEVEVSIAGKGRIEVDLCPLQATSKDRLAT